MSVSIVAVVIFAIIVIIFLSRKTKNESSQNIPGRVDGDEVRKNSHVLEKKSLKLMSYEDALEASKQFIYDITRAVMQRFTPSAQSDLMDIGRRLCKAGMQYFHVVDIMALSLEKSRARVVSPVKQEKTTSR